MDRLSKIIGRQKVIPRSLCAFIILPIATLALVVFWFINQTMSLVLTEKTKKEMKNRHLMSVGLKPSNETENSDNFGVDFGEIKFVHHVIVKLYSIIMYEKAFVNDLAPDVKMVDFESRKELSLLSYQQLGRPLLVNFGSCS